VDSQPRRAHYFVKQSIVGLHFAHKSYVLLRIFLKVFSRYGGRYWL